jgi:hypothetical protein
MGAVIGGRRKNTTKKSNNLIPVKCCNTLGEGDQSNHIEKGVTIFLKEN